MGRRRTRSLAAMVVALATVPLVQVPAGADPAAWTATALPVPADVFVQVNGTDGQDQIVGSFDFIDSEQRRPGVVWRGGELVVLGEAFGELTDLTAINVSGVAVGSHSDITELQRQATRYVGGHFEDLAAPADSDSVATAVNERGDVVGTADGQVILWPAAAPGTYKLLPMPFPTTATGVSITDNGTVAAGVLEPVGSGPLHAYRWDSQGKVHELGRVRPDAEHFVLTATHGRIAGGVSGDGAVVWDTKGTVQRFIRNVGLSAINDHGNILARKGAGPWFVQENGVRTPLPADFLPSGPTTLTNDGAVAGYSFDETTFEQTAVVWRRS